jgi:cytochrome P450
MTRRAPVADWASDFDHLDPAFVENPYPIWDELRQKCPIAHTERFSGVYLPLRYEDIRPVAYDPEHFSSRRIFVRKGRQPLRRAPPIASDPPEHRAERKVLLPAFTPLSRGHGPYAANCWNPFRTEADATARSTTRRRFRRAFEAGVTDPAMIERVVAEVSAFFNQEIVARRASPGDDLISCLLNTRIDGQPLGDDHINGTLRLLQFAGIDTTWSAIGTCLWHLATHADDRRRLVDDPQPIPTAVEEFLRAYAPVTMAREIVKDTEIDGCPFKQGEMEMLAFGAANRDPAMFPDADRVIVDREVNRHAAFGLGIHRCIGSTLARMELRVALEEWLGKFPAVVLTPGAVVKWSAGTVRGPRQLPITLGPR